MGNAVYIDALSVIPVETTRAQVIHNAPDLDAASVDVYVNGARLLDDLTFQSASPFVDLTAGVPTTIEVVPADAADNAAPLYAVRLDGGLAAGSATQLIASGVLDDTPDDDADDTEAEFQIVVAGDARETGESASAVDVRVVHGSPDAPAVDVLSGETALVDDLPYPGVVGYLPLAPDTYSLDVTTADGSALVGTYTVDLTGQAGAAVTLLTSGFLTPEDDGEGAPGFGLLVVFADGTTAPIAVPSERGPEAALSLTVANPVHQAATVRFTLDAPGEASVSLYDALGRRVATLADGDMGLGVQTARLDAAGLASGVYVLRLEAESGFVSQTITVVR